MSVAKGLVAVASRSLFVDLHSFGGKDNRKSPSVLDRSRDNAMARTRATERDPENLADS